MRFLIVSAVLACAAAAPSHLIAPVAVSGVPAVAVRGVPAVPAVAVPALSAVAYSAAAIPTLSPGDVQAAAIDAQVKAQDLAIAEADKARALLEQNSELITEKAITESDQVKESNEEAFWAAQDKQWQALDAVKTAEAQIDGAVASTSPILAKNVVAGPYIAGIAPISPIVYTSGVVVPAVKAAEVVTESKVEEAKVEEKKEAETKSAEPSKEKESVAIEAAKENLEAKSQLAPVVASLAINPYSFPYVGPVGVAPITPVGVAPISPVGVAPVGPVAPVSAYGVAPVLKYNAYGLGFAPVVKTVW